MAKIGNYVTNNIAEYEALIKALELASTHTNDEVTCVLDSELVVRQLLVEYRVLNPRLAPLFLKVQELQEKFKKVKNGCLLKTGAINNEALGLGVKTAHLG